MSGLAGSGAAGKLSFPLNGMETIPCVEGVSNPPPDGGIMEVMRDWAARSDRRVLCHGVLVCEPSDQSRKARNHA